MQTFLQGRVVIDQALTIRFTDSASSATRDVAFGAGNSFDSLDDFAAHLQTQIQGGGGNFADWAVEVIAEDEGANAAGTIKIATGHTGLQIDFNQGGAGTGTNLRTLLGHDSDTESSGSTPVYFASQALATFYPSRAALAVVRTGTSYDRMQMMTLAGHGFAQFNKDTNEAPLVSLRFSLQFMTPDGNFSELEEFETFLDTVFDNDLCGEPFTIHQGDDDYSVWFSGGNIEIRYQRMLAGWNGAWSLDLSLETWADN